MACRSSSPMSRCESRTEIFFLVMIQFLCDLSQYMCGNIVVSALRIECEQHDRSTLEAGGVYHPDRAAFAHAGSAPANLAASARSGNQIAGIGICGQMYDEFSMFFG